MPHQLGTRLVVDRRRIFDDERDHTLSGVFAEANDAIANEAVVTFRIPGFQFEFSHEMAHGLEDSWGLFVQKQARRKIEIAVPGSVFFQTKLAIPADDIIHSVAIIELI